MEGKGLKPGQGRPPEDGPGGVIGVNPVREVLVAGRRAVRRVLVQEGAEGRHSIREICALARKAGVRVDHLSRKAFHSRFPQKAAQGVAAEVLAKHPLNLEELLKVPASRKEPGLFVLLDGVEDPRNLGAVFRAAEATGVHGIVVPARRSAPVGATVAKTSAGALEFVDFAQVVNLRNAVTALKEAGCTVVGTDAGAPLPAWQADLSGPLALVLGGEDQGLRPVISRACDVLVSLPRQGAVNSLNVSVAAGMLLYEVRRQRSASG